MVIGGPCSVANCLLGIGVGGLRSERDQLRVGWGCQAGAGCEISDEASRTIKRECAASECELSKMWYAPLEC